MEQFIQLNPTLMGRFSVFFTSCLDEITMNSFLSLTEEKLLLDIITNSDSSIDINPTEVVSGST